jgi:hypothetical protein
MQTHRARYQTMGEDEIRRTLHAEWIWPNLMMQPGARTVDELVLLEGKHRVDVAVLNDEFHAFEIKSEGDNLDRLPKQQECYNKIFDRISLVVDERHVERAVAIVPRQWGLIAVSRSADGEACINEIWPARRNYSQDAFALTQLLWRDEALKILAKYGMARCFWTKRRKILWERIAQRFPLDQVRTIVRETLKARTDWRVEEEE